MFSKEDILKLNPDERILLIEEIWDTLTPDEIEIPDSQIAETRKRLEAIRNGDVSLSSWKDVRQRIRRQL